MHYTNQELINSLVNYKEYGDVKLQETLLKISNLRLNKKFNRPNLSITEKADKKTVINKLRLLKTYIEVLEDYKELLGDQICVIENLPNDAEYVLLLDNEKINVNVKQDYFGYLDGECRLVDFIYSLKGIIKRIEKVKLQKDQLAVKIIEEEIKRIEKL